MSTPTHREALKALRADALEIFDGPECPQAVRDAIEWYHSSILVALSLPKTEGAEADDSMSVPDAPKCIWLDIGAPLHAMDAVSFRDLEGVTWSKDNATGYGVKYVRADLAAPSPAGRAVEALRAALRAILARLEPQPGYSTGLASDIRAIAEAALSRHSQQAAAGDPVAYSVGRTLHWHEGKGITDAQLYAAAGETEGALDLAEVELIEKAAIKVGMKSLLNYGAASCVYSEGCNGVTQDHLVAFAREVALHCVAALAHPSRVSAEEAQDAERYRFLKNRLFGVDFDYQESGKTVLMFEWPDTPVSADCDETVDAARAAEGGAA